jgi:hypothetical protein
MKSLFLLLLIISRSLISYSQADRKVAMLNMSARNGDSGYSRTLSSIRLLTLAGVPFDSTSNLAVALTYPVILTGSRIQPEAFTSNELSLIENYVNKGGILITSTLREPLLYNLAGVSSSKSSSELYEIKWDTTSNPSYFDLIDDSLEVTVSLGREEEEEEDNYPTKYYTLSTGTALAHYEDGTVAMVKNAYGAGTVYTLGPDFRNVVIRNSINKDVNAQRTFSNGFEPTVDVFAFLIRNIIRKHIPNTVYKYPAPNNYSSVVMITHDVDSRTSYDTLANFAISENYRGIKAQYNLTTNYVPHSWISDLYIGTGPKVEFLLSKGHAIGSHSVGHFPDFANSSIFPFGTLGNDSSNYHPFYNGIRTLNGSILGEVEVSKKLLEKDFNVSIKSWRSGHLEYPDSLVLALDTLGYEFNSTYSANDVLTGFPYYASRTQSFSSAQSKILEIPMTISDVFLGAKIPISIDNYMTKVQLWVDVTRKYDRNNASTVLLIHPNRNYKLTAQEAYLDLLPKTMKGMAFEDFGSFWRKRDSLLYHSELQNNALTVKMDSKYDNLLSFVIDTLSLNSISFLDMNGNPIKMISQQYGTSQKLFYQKDQSIVAGISEKINQLDFSIYPNPSGDVLNVFVDGSFGDFEVIIYSIDGQQITQAEKFKNSSFTINLNQRNFKSGMYFIQLKTAGRVNNKRFIYIQK